MRRDRFTNPSLNLDQGEAVEKIAIEYTHIFERELAKQRQLKGLPSNGGKVDKNGYAPFRN